MKDSFGRPPTSLDGYIQAASERGTAGDVYVWPHLMLEDAIGKSGGKLVAAKAFTLKAEVVSAYGTGKKEPSARGTVFQNVQVLKEGCGRVRSAILQDLGPSCRRARPSRRSRRASVTRRCRRCSSRPASTPRTTRARGCASSS